MKLFIILVLFLFSIMFPESVYADRYGTNDPSDDLGPTPIWLIIYMAGGIFLGASPKSPLNGWANENFGKFIVILLFMPVVFTSIFDF
jgi:hypothetical protein